ncbi:M48 family metalloprotease [Pragia fontium]|uniref:Metalloprotease n=1 Tax=Pragia fontium DSM 5563 = ATCC 49100 TaxID=1122977 RepID=A0AAJ5BFZ3_9GAMM|nr:M48 family metalloprotease [Pragia fontium]SFC10313.1 putative metalloprotease [Pragia fontium DSM 5563 = ATCC 49100]SUB81410.1 Uncharacterized metalloprotease yggG [Pragia fontium]VEJ53655.1 Uncharacterized metalloprotease yggG [Pragia fontium]
MKLRSTLMALTLASATMLAGCQNGSLGDALVSSVTISDGEVKALSDQSCAQMDSESKIAGKNSKYTKRLNKIAKKLGNNVNGQPLNYKVYLTEDVNAWAMANGCIRVYSGLMDLMTDDEVTGVIGHEIGHVELGHTKKRFQVAIASNKAAGFATDLLNKHAGKVTELISADQISGFAHQIVNAQFSQSQESEADGYSYDYLKARKLNTKALATAFDKLGGGDASLMSSHPGSKERADAIRARISADGGK